MLSYRIASDNLQLGLSVVADSYNPIELTRQQWEQVAKEAHARFVNIEIVCSDSQEHRRRVETRVSTVSGLRLPTWKEVENLAFHNWKQERTVIDHQASESFRILRAKLERFKAINPELKLIAISSSVPKEGKSFVSANLARTVSSAKGNKVLLIDCDLRHPSMQSYFSMSSVGLGMAKLLTDEGVDDVPVISVSKQLDVLPVGECPENAIELLNGDIWRRNLRKLREIYTHVFLDTPPVMLCNESIGLTAMADATLLVVRAWNTDRQTFLDALSTIERGRVLGVVMNQELERSKQYSVYDSYYYAAPLGQQKTAPKK